MFTSYAGISAHESLEEGVVWCGPIYTEKSVFAGPISVHARDLLSVVPIMPMFSLIFPSCHLDDIRSY